MARTRASELRRSTAVIPDRIGRYVVLAPIGSGGMGVVWRARDPELDREVAIKVVRISALALARNESARARLLAEARALARISHPNVVAVYEVGVHDGDVFVAMELVDGVDLEGWLKQRTRSIADVVEVFVAAARGLARVHAAGLVHRDVKPANIFVAGHGTVKIGDFGIARTTAEPPRPQIDGEDLVADLDVDTTALTAEGRVVGTPAYMAPEQHLGSEVGPAADQYALAVALFEAVWGQRPFRVDARRLLAAKLGGVVIPATDRRVPRWLLAIVQRGLAYDPGDRFASMDAFAEALLHDPARARRRRLALGVGGLAIAGATAMLVRAPGVCEHDDDALVGAWDPPTRAAVERAFLDSPRPWAAASWARVRVQLDAYADAWRAMHRDACLATRVRGEQSEAMLDRRMACLTVRRRGLAAATDLLARGDDDAIDHALDLLARLRPIATCGDAIALAAAVAPIDDAPAVDAVRTELARGRALSDAGRHPDALRIAETASMGARALDYPPLLVEALAFEGRERLRLGPIDQARATLEAALWQAIAIGHDEAAAAAATDLAWVAGQYDRSLPDATRWAELARASLQRAGRADPIDAMQIDSALGLAQLQTAHHDEAMASFERALARVADDPDAVSPRADAQHNLAKAWLERGELAKARAVLEPAIADLASVLGDDHPRVATMRGTLAQVFGAAGEHARAVELFTAEVEGLRAAMGDDALAVANARTNLGVSLGRMGRMDEAIAVTELALAAFERGGDDGGAATCLGNIADDLLQQGIHDAAASRFQRALALLERMYPEGHPDLLYPLVGIGRVRMAQHRFAEALASYERADGMITRVAGSSAHARGLALDGRARALVALGRNDDAGVVFDEQIAVLRAATDALPDELPHALLQRCELLRNAKRVADALRDCDEALALTNAPGLEVLHEIAVTEQAKTRSARP
ncbi:MAG TPA: tetratricopeptide repeat protein [Nannocystaceae bacterium]|nr:tetratricopeptide repeat protein [Nannocystaceae bacterium]